MIERQPRERPDEKATQLFAEYLAAREAGEARDIEALCARAGPHADELRERIRALSILDQLGSALRDEGAEDVPREPRVNVARLGRYENLRLLGEGGLSRVYVALDPDLQREVALKVIASEHVTLDAARNWILQEGRTIARLEHPGIVRVFDLGEVDGLTFVAMELVDGPSLADVLDVLRARKSGGTGPSDDARVLAAADRLAGIGARTTLALRIARALAACHAGGVFHRDIKPGNVLLAAGGEPKLIDFGLAHLEEAEGSLNRVTQRLIGTPAYIAPEQVESGQTGKDPRSDQFSFGVLLYELLTLRAPFQRSTRTQTLDAVTRALPTLPRKLDAAIPADLETICLHALERLPGDRYPSMDALAADLEAFLEHRAIAISAPGVSRRLKLWARRNRRDLALFAIPALVLTAIATGVHSMRVRAELSALQADVESRIARLDGDQDPLSIQSAFTAASELARRADEVDGSWLVGRFLSPVRPRVDHLVREISHTLAFELSRARAGLEKSRGPATAGIENEVLRSWQSALVLDEVLCPNCPENARDRVRGRIELPKPEDGTSLEVVRVIPGLGSGVMALVPLKDPKILGLGEYRVLWADALGQLLAEFELGVEFRTDRATLQLKRIAPGMRARFVRVPAGSVTMPGFPAQEHAEFFALADWQSSDPKLELTPRQVRERALEASARIPTAIEARAMLQLTAQGLVDLPPLPSEFSGEHCGGANSGEVREILLHTRDPLKPAGSRLISMDGVYPNRSAYRLVVSGPLAP